MRKMLLALTGAAALALATSANAAVEIDFNNPTGGLGPDETYTDGTLSVTASGWTAGNSVWLWGKSDGAGEEGVGLANDPSSQREIWYNPDGGAWVSLDVTDLFGQATSVSFAMDSTTLGEEWAVYGSDVAGTLGTWLLSGSVQGNWTDLPNFGDYDFYQFVAVGDDNTGKPSNVLLHGITITNAVPEPATWAMMLLGFGAVGFSMRRRRRIALTQLA